MCKHPQIWEPLHGKEHILKPVRRTWHTVRFTLQQETLILIEKSVVSVLSDVQQTASRHINKTTNTFSLACFFIYHYPCGYCWFCMGKDRFGEGKDCSHLAADEQSLLSSMMRRTCALWANDRKLLGVKKNLLGMTCASVPLLPALAQERCLFAQPGHRDRRGQPGTGPCWQCQPAPDVV